jgi:deoxycytidylate deaminase
VKSAPLVITVCLVASMIPLRAGTNVQLSTAGQNAERNCIYNASRIGVSLDECHLYCTHFPCPDCTRGIIQSGITWLFYPQDLSEEAKGFRERIYEAHLISLDMLVEAGIECRVIKGFDTQNFSIEAVQPVDLAP